MTIRLIKSAWGLVGSGNRYASLVDFAESAQAEQYVGVEFPVFYLEAEPGTLDEALARTKECIEQRNLSYVALIATKAESWGDYDAHLESFKSQCELAARLGANKASVHAGADSFGAQQGRRFLEVCSDIAAEFGIRPCFETHRARILYNPFTCAELLDALPSLELTSDLSHWLLVVDRVPTDIMDLFDEASARTGHLHARIGHEKSPQVTEPSDPAWSNHVQMYRRWWEISVRAQMEKGERLTVAPEFGPPPYMHAEPFTAEPSADIVAVNQWMRDQLQDWFLEE